MISESSKQELNCLIKKNTKNIYIFPNIYNSLYV